MSKFLEKLKKNKFRTFILPTLQEEITYTRLDTIDASINGSLPNFLTSKVLDVMKKSIKGEKPVEEIPDIQDSDLKDIIIRATELWKKHVVEPKLTDEEVLDVPAEDRMAWLFDAVFNSQTMKTEGGGELTAEEVGNFPM